MKDWEIIADRLNKAGWSLGWVSATRRERYSVRRRESKDVIP
jgi:hypothetical protein